MRISKYALNGSAILFGLLMCIFSSAAGSNTTETAQNDIRATLEKWTKDFNAGNSTDVCALFAPDLISSYQGQHEGDYNSLCAQLLASLNDPVKTYHYSLQIKEILVCGDLAVARLTWLLRRHALRTDIAANRDQCGEGTSVPLSCPNFRTWRWNENSFILC